MSAGIRSKQALSLGLMALTAVLVAACGQASQDYPEGGSQDRYRGRPVTDRDRQQEGGLFGPGGLTIFGSSPQQQRRDNEPGIAVNSFLWRGALDTISFMPLASADPFGGVIITDWYQPPETPGERVKVHILILDRELRADGVRASIFRQRYDAARGGWIDEQVDPKTATDLENTVLTRARQLRISQLGS